jgi:hypothetical protein
MSVRNRVHARNTKQIVQGQSSVMGLERSSDVVLTESVGQPGNGEEPARAVKPFGIAKRVVYP